MKPFAIIQSGREVHIRRTDGQTIPNNVRAGEADTYEEAVIIRDSLRAKVQEQRSIATDKWHDQWRKAEDRGDMDRLLKLGGCA